MTNSTSTAKDTDQMPKNNFKTGLPKQKKSFSSALTEPETRPKPSVYIFICFFLFAIFFIYYFLFIFVITIIVACIHVDLLSFFDIAKGKQFW